MHQILCDGERVAFHQAGAHVISFCCKEGICHTTADEDYIYFFEHRKAQEDKEREEAAKKVFSIDWEDLTGLRVEDSFGTFLMEKTRKGEEEAPGAGSGVQGQEWRLLEPVKTDGDDTVLNGLVNTLKDLEIAQVVSEAPESLEPFGLKEPAIKIGIETASGGQKPALLLVGDKSPVGQNSYAMKEGEGKVLLLSSYLDTQFDKSPFGLRRKTMFSFNQNEVAGIGVLRNGQNRFELARQEGKWRLVQPFRSLAAESEARALLSNLAS